MAPKTTFTWNKQFGVGNEGEAFFLSVYDGAEKSKDKRWDFEIGDIKIELKTDTYSLDKTENFFMERFGNEAKQTEGGVWRAAKDGVDFFVYLFLRDGVFYWFEPKRLKRVLDARIKKMKPKKIFNKGYETVGYLIPIKSVKHLVIQEDRIEKE